MYITVAHKGVTWSVKKQITVECTASQQAEQNAEQRDGSTPGMTAAAAVSCDAATDRCWCVSGPAASSL